MKPAANIIVGEPYSFQTNPVNTGLQMEDLWNNLVDLLEILEEEGQFGQIDGSHSNIIESGDLDYFVELYRQEGESQELFLERCEKLLDRIRTELEF